MALSFLSAKSLYQQETVGAPSTFTEAAGLAVATGEIVRISCEETALPNRMGTVPVPFSRPDLGRFPNRQSRKQPSRSAVMKHLEWMSHSDLIRTTIPDRLQRPILGSI
jgi:hypothetical protein